MATWATLKADAAQITDMNDDVIKATLGVLTAPSELAGTATTDIYLDRAKEEMKQDLLFAHNLDPNDSDDLSALDDIVNYNEDYLKKSLAFKQLCLFYTRYNGGELTVNHDRMARYCSYYQNNKSLFQKLKSSAGNITDISTAKIKL